MFQQFASDGNSGYEENIAISDIETAVLINELAVKIGMPLSEMAQRYLFSIAEATRIVIGARKLNQIINTISSWNAGALSYPQFNEITQIIFRNQTVIPTR